MFPWLSSFLMNPGLALGAGVIASPILIHILSKRRYRRVRWAAMDFLLEAQKKNRRRVRMEQLLLLALRCMAVLLIALMLMRPFVRPGAFASILGASPRTERIVLIDDSFSMDYRPRTGRGAAQSAFDEAVEATVQLAQWASIESPADVFTVYLSSRPREPVASLSSLSDASIEDVRQKLGGLRPSQSRSKMADALAAVADVITRSPTQLNAAAYVVSDFQRSDWILPREEKKADDRPAGSVISPLSAISRAGASVKLVLIKVGASDAENAAIAGVVAGQAQCVSGVPARFEVTVANYTRGAFDQVQLGLSIADTRLPPVMIGRVQPGQVIREPVEVTFPNEGSNYLRVELAGAESTGDVVRLDNARIAPVDVVPAIQDLIVDGEASTDPYRDEVYLLRTALRPEGRAASGIEVSVVEEQELESIDLSPFHVVTLANVGRLSRASLRNIESFVQSGGGLLIFAGDQLDIDHYNHELFRDGDGFFPVRLTEIVETPPGVDRMTFSRWDAGHPVMRSFTGGLAELLRQVKIGALIGSETPVETADAIAATQPSGSDASELPDSAENLSPFRVVARFNDPAESAAIVQRKFGRGLCIFIATTADQEWNDWAASFSYLPMMLELVQYAARSTGTLAEATVGQPLVLGVDLSRFNRTAQVRTPNYPMEPEMAVEVDTGRAENSTGVAETPANSAPAPAQPDAQSRFEYRDTRSSGVYEFKLQSPAGATANRYAAVNPDAAESNFASATKLELESALAEEMPYEFVADASVLSQQSNQGREELWWPILMAAIAVLMLEQGLAWWFGTRG